MKSEVFLLGMIDIQMENSNGSLFLYMIMAVRLLYALQLRSSATSAVEKWLVKMLELLEMATFTT